MGVPLALAVAWMLASGAEGHAWMIKPTSRMVAAHERGEEYCYHCANGISPCGVIMGKDYTTKAFDTSVASRGSSTLSAGGVVEIDVGVNAHHYGHVEFYLCTDATRADLWECFKEHRLVRSEAHEHLDPAPIDPLHPERWYFPPKGIPRWPLDLQHPERDTVFRMWFKVPSGVSCVGGKCLMHFFYHTGNSCTGKDYTKYYTVNEGEWWVPRGRMSGTEGQWAFPGDSWIHDDLGTCYTKTGGAFTGQIDDNAGPITTPERFWNCADVTVGGGGGDPSTPTPTTQEPVPATPTPVTPTPGDGSGPYYFPDYSLGGGLVDGEWKHRCGCQAVPWTTPHTTARECVAAWKAEGQCADPSNFGAVLDAQADSLAVPLMGAGAALLGVGAALAVVVARRRRQHPVLAEGVVPMVPATTVDI